MALYKSTSYSTAMIIVHLLAFALINMMPDYKTPNTVDGQPPVRMFGIFSTRDMFITFIASGIVSFLSGTNIILCFLAEFILGQFIHYIFSANTMTFYLFNLSEKPNGLGKLALPVSSHPELYPDNRPEIVKKFIGDTIVYLSSFFS